VWQVAAQLHILQAVVLLCRSGAPPEATLPLQMLLPRALPPVFILRTTNRPQNDNDCNKHLSKRARANTALILFFAKREWREFRPGQHETKLGEIESGVVATRSAVIGMLRQARRTTSDYL
jgi:hypothetical protein